MSDNLLQNIDINDWHPQAIARLNEAMVNRRLAHALLVGGVPGIGKRLLARELAATLLCAAPAAPGLRACRTCKSCRLLAAGTHPDLLSLQPPPEGRSIGVDAVRELCAALATTAQLGGNRAGLVIPADALTPNAANSLLKSLEEPPSGTYLILVSDHPARLLATVRSRCQQLALGLPAPAAAGAWLAAQLGEDAAKLWLSVARGAPLQALLLAEEGARDFRKKLFAVFADVLRGAADPVEAAASFGGDMRATLALLEAWVTDLIRLRAGGERIRPANTDLQATLHALAPRLDLTALFGYLERIHAAAASPVALNGQLVVEELFVAAERLPQQR